MIFMRMSEVTLWRGGMQTFYCDEVFGGRAGCVPRAVVAEERLRGRRDLSYMGCQKCPKIPLYTFLLLFMIYR